MLRVQAREQKKEETNEQGKEQTKEKIKEQKKEEIKEEKKEEIKEEIKVKTRERTKVRIDETRRSTSRSPTKEEILRKKIDFPSDESTILTDENISRQITNYREKKTVLDL